MAEPGARIVAVAGQPAMGIDPDGNAQHIKVGSGGGLQVAGQGLYATVSFDRPADTSPYTAGDVEGSATAAGGAVLTLQFKDKDGNNFTGGEVMITTAMLELGIAAMPSGMTSYELIMHNATPNSNLGDNGVWDDTSGDRATYLDFITMGTPVDRGSTCRISTDGINKQITVPTGGAIKAYLRTVGGYTPASGTSRKVVLHGIPL